MAQELPEWLSSYLKSKGLFSDRFNTPVKQEKEELKPTAFKNTVRRIIENDDYNSEDALTSLFKSSSSTPNQGLFGKEGRLPNFLEEMKRQSMASIAGEIVKNTNYNLQDRIGAGLSLAASALIPFPLSLFGMAMNASGYGPSFDPEKNTNLTVDPLTGIAKYGQREYTEEEPEVPNFSRMDLFEEIPELLATEAGRNTQIGLLGPFNTTLEFSPYSFLDQYTATPEQQEEQAQLQALETDLVVEAAKEIGAKEFQDFSDAGLSDAASSAAVAEELGYDAGFDDIGDEGFY
tara:strand:- start:797 stop:1669 length:873 start_codon:yes stop_codon:yes gene_type:complete